MTKPTLGQLIRQHRERIGWTRYRLAKECGLAQTALNRIETGRSDPQFTTMCRITTALSVSLEEFRV